MYKDVELYEGIEKLIDSVNIKIDNEGSEMDDAELAFLCRMIRKKRPKKFWKLAFLLVEQQQLF